MNNQSKNFFSKKLEALKEISDQELICFLKQVMLDKYQVNVQQDQEWLEVTYYIAERLVEEPTLEEVLKAFNKLKNNKAPSNDSIAAKCLKHGKKFP